MRRALVAALLLLAASAHAERRFDVSFHLGGLVRNGGSYPAHSEAFGFRSEAGFALGLRGSMRLTSRLRLVAMTNTAFSHSTRNSDPDESLEIVNLMYLLGVGATVHRIDLGDHGWWLALEASALTGFYRVQDKLGAYASQANGPGVSLGGELVIGAERFRASFGYLGHLTTTHITDRLGGDLGAGGHQILLQAGYRF